MLSVFLVGFNHLSVVVLITKSMLKDWQAFCQGKCYCPEFWLVLIWGWNIIFSMLLFTSFLTLEHTGDVLWPPSPIWGIHASWSIAPIWWHSYLEHLGFRWAPFGTLYPPVLTDCFRWFKVLESFKIISTMSFICLFWLLTWSWCNFVQMPHYDWLLFSQYLFPWLIYSL